MLIVALAAGVGCALGAGAYFLLEDDPPRPAVFRSEPTSALYAPIDSRERDPRPLTPAEVFADERVTSGAVTLVRQATESLSECAAAVWGDAAVQATGGCTQVLRARYTTPDGTVAGQAVIFNMSDGAAADRLVAALRPGGGFVREVPGHPGGFDAARGWAQARALGHYVTVSWVAPVGGEGQIDLTRHQIALDTVMRTLHRRVVDAS